MLIVFTVFLDLPTVSISFWLPTMKNEDLTQTPQVVLVVKSLPATVPGGGHGSPRQHSCLENPVDIGSHRVRRYSSDLAHSVHLPLIVGALFPQLFIKSQA